MQIEINNIDDLTDFILQTKLSSKEVNEIIRNALQVIVINEHSKEELAALVIDFYNSYSRLQERPLFLDIIYGELNVKDLRR